MMKLFYEHILYNNKNDIPKIICEISEMMNELNFIAK